MTTDADRKEVAMLFAMQIQEERDTLRDLLRDLYEMVCDMDEAGAVTPCTQDPCPLCTTLERIEKLKQAGQLDAS